MSDAAPLVVFSDDWGRHPSSCQHLVQLLLPHRRVTWVNTIGLRPPRFDCATVNRSLEKFHAWFGRTGSGTAESPRVLNPVMWPSFGSRLTRGLNRRLLTRTVRIANYGSSPPVIVTTLPIVADLVGRVRAKRWVYYCVDDYSVWPGLAGRTLRNLEAALVAKVDVAVAVSEPLQTHLAKLGKPAHLLTHGVDLDFWRKPAAADAPISIRELEGPLVVFWGVIDRRTDAAIIRELAASMKGGAILFVGPLDNPDPELRRLPRVHTIPPVALAVLPALAAQADVLIAPYADLPVTRAMQPLKLKEYLATGKPVVARRLPATETWSDCADVVETPREFAAAVLERISTGLPEDQRRARARLVDESWTAKAVLFERWVDGE